MVTRRGFLAVNAHEEFAADLERESTALRLWAVAYRFNLLRGLLADGVVGAKTWAIVDALENEGPAS